MKFYQSLFYAIPIFTILIFMEMVWGKLKNVSIYSNIADTLSSLSSGLANIIVKTMGIYVTILGYSWFLENFSLFQVQVYSLWAWIITFISIDLAGYWLHRWSHYNNFLWQTHLIHHSSEEFNLAVALRQSTTSFFEYGGFLLLPAAILGVPVEMITVGSFIHLYMQYWYHTQLINKMWILDRIIVTPSNHRVHHAMNPEYIDKNFGQILIIWDHLFGTYQKELEHIEPVYGITVPVKTWNPLKIDFIHWTTILKDAWNAEKWIDKFYLFFNKVGWRPLGHDEKFPIKKVKDVTKHDKYNTSVSLYLKILSTIEVVFIALPLTLIFFWMIENGITLTEKVFYSSFLLFSIFTYTTTLEGKSTRLLNSLRFTLSLILIYSSTKYYSTFDLLSYNISMIFVFFFLISTVSSFLIKPSH